MLPISTSPRPARACAQPSTHASPGSGANLPPPGRVRTCLRPRLQVRPVEPERVALLSGPMEGTPLQQPALRITLFEQLPEGTTGRPGQPLGTFVPSDELYLERGAFFPDHFPYQRAQRGGLAGDGGRTNHVLDFKLFNYLPKDEAMVDFVNVVLPQLHSIQRLETTLACPSSSVFQKYTASTELYNQYAAIAQALGQYIRQAAPSLWAIQNATQDDSDTDSDDDKTQPCGPVAEVHAKYQALYMAAADLRQAAIQAEHRWLSSGGRT